MSSGSTPPAPFGPSGSLGPLATPPLSTPQAWLCDLDGTLYRAGLMKWFMAGELALFGARHVPLIQKFREAHESLREELRIEPNKSFDPSPFEEQVVRTARATGVSEPLVRDVVLEWMVRRPGKWLRRSIRKSLIAEIESFRHAGGKTALVSDYPAIPKLEAMGLRDLFDVVVASGEHPDVKRLKPSPDSYEIAARALGVEPSLCLVIGDRDDADGDAARRAGMQFRLVGREQR